MHKRKLIRYTVALCFLLSIGLSFTITKIVSYRSELQYQVELSQAQSAHIGNKPIYIFTDKEVDWSDLTPHLETIYGKNVKKDIVGTFPVPHNYNGTDITNITSDNDKIYFPSYGMFYLHTTVGFFKLLLLNPNLSEDEKIVAIASFISGNSVHSKADARIIRPFYKGKMTQYTTSRLLKPFFASDQPLKLHCGHIAIFLSYVLSHQGYSVQLVQLQTEDRKKGHIVMQVFLPKANKFVMIDPDRGAIVRDSSQNILSIQEIAILVREKPESLLIEDIGNKNSLKAIYNNPEPMPEFSWTPDKSGKTRLVRKDHYLQLMKDKTAVYLIYDEYTSDEWIQPYKFYWNGSVLME